MATYEDTCHIARRQSTKAACDILNEVINCRVGGIYAALRPLLTARGRIVLHEIRSNLSRHCQRELVGFVSTHLSLA